MRGRPNTIALGSRSGDHFNDIGLTNQVVVYCKDELCVF